MVTLGQDVVGESHSSLGLPYAVTLLLRAAGKRVELTSVENPLVDHCQNIGINSI